MQQLRWCHLPKGAAWSPAGQRADKKFLLRMLGPAPTSLLGPKQSELRLEETSAIRQSGKFSHMRTDTKNRRKLGGKGGTLELPREGEEEVTPEHLLSILVRLCRVLAGHVSRGAVS